MTKLIIGRNILNDVYDCSLLKYLPQLETLEGEGFRMDNNLETETNRVKDTSNNTIYHNHIKNLILQPYHPSSDDGLLHIMNYTELEQLTTSQINGKSWPLTISVHQSWLRS